MRKQFVLAAACAAMIGTALAQIEASSASTYLLDIDPAQYAGPTAQRLMLRVGDQPRHITIGKQHEICVQLQRDAVTGVINVRVRTLTSEPKSAEVRLVAPDIS